METMRLESTIADLHAQLPGRLVLVWNGSVYQALGKDAAAVSRLAPSSTSLHALGRGRPLLAIVRRPNALIARAKRAGVALALYHPDGDRRRGIGPDVLQLRGRHNREQLRQLIGGQINVLLFPVEPGADDE